MLCHATLGLFKSFLTVELGFREELVGITDDLFLQSLGQKVDMRQWKGLFLNLF